METEEVEMEVSEEQGGRLLLLGVPQYSHIGIDTQMFSAGPDFKGFKMIPPGPHFVYYRSSNRSGTEFSPVVGFFIYTGSSDVLVRQWNPQEERMLRLLEDEEERYCLAVKSMEFDKHLGPYPVNLYESWKQLSNFITKATIERIEPIGGEITVCSEFDVHKEMPETKMEKALAEQLKSSKFPSSVDVSGKHRCYYTPIPHLSKQKGISGNELTYLNLDKTELLENMLAEEYGGCEDLFLGEMQFAFVAFLMGQSLEAFMQWKSIVSLMLSCIEAPFRTRSQLFTKFIRAIYHQLKFGLRNDGNRMGENGASALLDDSWFNSDSFLHHLFKDFLSLVQDSSSVDGDLLSWTRRLKDLLEDALGWALEQNNVVDGIYINEDDEYAPVVVYDESNNG